MEVNVNFDIVQDGKDILFKQVVEKRLKFDESMKELKTLDTEMLQLYQQMNQLKDALNTKKLEKDVDNLDNQIKKLKEVKLKWEKINTPLVEELTKNIKSKIRKEKARVS